jgi:uncharacterized protein YeaO (DUF488 family)
LIRVQRIYDNPRENNNGNDFRHWPRGLSKDEVKIDLGKRYSTKQFAKKMV